MRPCLGVWRPLTMRIYNAEGLGDEQINEENHFLVCLLITKVATVSASGFFSALQKQIDNFVFWVLRSFQEHQDPMIIFWSLWVLELACSQTYICPTAVIHSFNPVSSWVCKFLGFCWFLSYVLPRVITVPFLGQLSGIPAHSTRCPLMWSSTLCGWSFREWL